LTAGPWPPAAAGARGGDTVTARVAASAPLTRISIVQRPGLEPIASANRGYQRP
jgi:hypothetical protein